jgi:hypothetical protein
MKQKPGKVEKQSFSLRHSSLHTTIKRKIPSEMNRKGFFCFMVELVRKGSNDFLEDFFSVKKDILKG